MPITVNIGGYSSDIDINRIDTLYPNARNWKPQLATTTNIQLEDIGQQALGLGANAIASLAGIPQVAQVGQSFLSLTNVSDIRSQFAVAAVGNNRPLPGVQYPDFRSRKGYGNPLQVRLDGGSAALRGSFKAGALAAASASPLGPYSIFNLDGFGKTGYGWGDHGNPYALRNDFTVRSNVATIWRTNVTTDPETKKFVVSGEWLPTRNPIELATAFRGDKVNVIDFGKRTLKQAYRWKPDRLPAGRALGAVLDRAALTQDFIKFYFTGPKLQAGSLEEDDIIVFRAVINNISDTFSPNWSPQQMIGRADPNYHYTQVTRDLQLDFTVYATSRDELKPIWRKLNALAGYTAPEYDSKSIALKAPWMRITIGDLFVQQAVVITSLGYTIHDTDTTWEINLEDDPTMMQTPHKISVSLGLIPIMDQLPQKGGRFYTLAKDFDANAQPKVGSDNWLSDTITNPDIDKQLESLEDLKKYLSNREYKQFNKTKKDVTIEPQPEDELNRILKKPI